MRAPINVLQTEGRSFTDDAQQNSVKMRSKGLLFTDEYHTNEMSLNKIGTALVFISMMAISISLITLALISIKT